MLSRSAGRPKRRRGRLEAALRAVAPAFALLVLELAAPGCRPARAPLSTGDERAGRAFRGAGWNRGSESYSAWFADTDGRTLYFGASPFWSLWWETGGDPRADLREAGDHLIGRFDMKTERWLPPLRVRSLEEGARGSVWDVLVHSNGRIYYTTFFEETGSVLPDGGDVRHFDDVGTGLNEIAEGPGGRLFVTRYGSGESPSGDGSVVVLRTEGALLRELAVGGIPGVAAAPKSVAVDPLTGEIWCNADLLSGEDPAGYASFRLSPEGEILDRWVAPPELEFVTFGPDGLGWLAETERGWLSLRAMRNGREVARARIDRVADLDFVQDIKWIGPRRVVLASWSGRAFVARLEGTRIDATEIRLPRPADCVPPEGRSILYTAVVHGGSVFATLYCGWTVLRAPL